MDTEKQVNPIKEWEVGDVVYVAYSPVQVALVIEIDKERRAARKGWIKVWWLKNRSVTFESDRFRNYLHLVQDHERKAAKFRAVYEEARLIFEGLPL